MAYTNLSQSDFSI